MIALRTDQITGSEGLAGIWHVHGQCTDLKATGRQPNNHRRLDVLRSHEIVVVLVAREFSLREPGLVCQKGRCPAGHIGCGVGFIRERVDAAVVLIVGLGAVRIDARHDSSARPVRHTDPRQPCTRAAEHISEPFHRGNPQLRLHSRTVEQVQKSFIVRRLHDADHLGPGGQFEMGLHVAQSSSQPDTPERRVDRDQKPIRYAMPARAASKGPGTPPSIRRSRPAARRWPAG